MKTNSTSLRTNRSRQLEVVNRNDSSERMQETLALLKILAHGERQIEAGQVQPASEVIARLKRRSF